MTCSSPVKDKYFHGEFSLLIALIPQIFVWLFGNHFLRYVEHLFRFKIFSIFDGMQIVWVMVLHEYCWFHGYRHEHSPYHRMFFAVFCNIHRRSCVSLPHLIVHPVQEWSGLHWQFYFCFIISNDELLLWPCPFYHPSIHQISTLEKTKFYQRSFWEACWVRAFNESLVVPWLLTCVTADNGFHRSIMFPYCVILVLQGKAGAIGVSNFLRAFLMVSLSSGAMKNIPPNFRAFSRWNFSSDHFCFSFSLACFPIDFQISGH